MMGLAHGKVSECTARLALAQGLVKVSSKLTFIAYQIFYLLSIDQNVEKYSKTDGVVHRDISEKVTSIKFVHTLIIDSAISTVQTP